MLNKKTILILDVLFKLPIEMNGGQQTQQQANISGSYGDLGSGYGAYNAVDD